MCSTNEKVRLSLELVTDSNNNTIANAFLLFMPFYRHWAMSNIGLKHCSMLLHFNVDL